MRKSDDLTENYFEGVFEYDKQVKNEGTRQVANGDLYVNGHLQFDRVKKQLADDLQEERKQKQQAIKRQKGLEEMFEKNQYMVSAKAEKIKHLDQKVSELS